MDFTVAAAMCQPDQLLDIARATERAGWDAVAMPDAVFYPETVSAEYPYTSDGSRFWSPDEPFVDPWVAIPAMAAVTDRINFYTNVIKATLREPLLLAKTLSSAAAMYPGRIAVGVGMSWIPEEFEWLHTDMATRGQRLDEIIEVLRLTTSANEMVSHSGPHYSFGRLQLSPVAPDPIPIYVGGHSKPALRRAASRGDGWISALASVDDLATYISTVHELLRENGRPIEGFKVAVTPFVMPEVSAVEQLASIGVTDIITAPWYFYGGDPGALDTKLASIDQFAEEIIVAFR